MSIQAFVPGIDEVASIEMRRGLAVRRWGTGNPLVLLHGGMGSWSHWLRNIGALAREFTVITLDMPGYGSSNGAGFIDWRPRRQAFSTDAPASSAFP